MNKKSSIGVFDSGIGGLTVLREITKILPNENTVYLGDTARVPYGSKSKETIERYSFEIATFLLKHDIKILVAACNTASAFAVPKLKTGLSIPVTGVIEPGARAAALASKVNRIGVIGTEGTIKSSAYTTAIKAVKPGAEVFVQACPLFVPLVEEGWAEDEVTAIIAQRYLSDFKDAGIDTLVLGCTHYPLLKDTIDSVMGEGVTLIDSAASTAIEVKKILEEKGLINDVSDRGAHKFFVTDSPERFMTVGRRFFGEKLDYAELATLTEN